ncbi:transposase [Streptomyces sp. NPDC091209]|uniref:transposase n=1 Tax=Streptomyces sp. NPDC091209 TaxID=3365974 RepID=UPI0037FF2AE6
MSSHQTSGRTKLLVGRWSGRTSILDPHKPYLPQRWAEGCTVARRLSPVACRLSPVRRNTRARLHRRREGREEIRGPAPRAFPLDPPRKAPSVRDVTGWLTRHPERLAIDQAQRLRAILARRPARDRTADHVCAFAELMHNRQGRDLDQWITGVQADDLPALHTLITGLGQDLDAVVAGLSLPNSSDAVEGHNNKIKMAKHQMFGRANFDLLRKRVLLAPRARS